MMAEFGIARASVREVMRILETEGLVTVQRGNVGGAVVHAPDPHGAAYLLGLVMQANRVTLADLSMALLTLEPACARFAADRADRNETVVPLLDALNKRAEAVVDNDPEEFTQIQREWHHALIENCGNRTMVYTLSTVETVWSYHVSRETAAAAAAGSKSIEFTRATLQVH